LEKLMAEMLIAGEHAAAASGEEIAVVDPATEETIASVPSGGQEDVNRAVEAADAAFAEWSRTDAEDRANLLRRAVGLIEGARKELTESLVHEQGKPLTEAAGEIHHFIHGLNYYADLATKVRGSYQPLPSTLSKAYGMVIRRPMGVVAAIVPNNFPLTLLGTKLAPALMAGNTIVVKPAQTTPLTTLKVADLLLEAEIPPGVVNVVTGRGSEIGDALVTHDKVRRVAFTGSTEVGRHIMGLAAPKFKRMTMELGGSDPVIICPDANLKAASRGVAIGRFWNAGQMCLGGKRIYVFDEVYDDFMAELTRTVGKYEPGEGWVKAEKPNIRIGPLHTGKQRDEVMEQLQDALDGGGELVLGGDVPEGRDKGYFLQPTIVANPPHDGRVAREETFGPVLPVWRVTDLDEAIRLSNDSEYGLGSSVWTNDMRTIHRVAQEVDSGMTWVNQFHYGYDELPFGGTKQSGYGKEHGIEALDYYFEDKSVVVGGLE
jgi:succinate-semialdehyde dehydrogenase/glutarate-semialdehyde dehydrogenase